MALEIDAGFGKALQVQTYLLAMQGRHQEAITCAQRLVAILGPSHLSLFTLGLAYAASGDRAQVDHVLTDTEKLPRGSEGSPAAIASIHMLLKVIRVPCGCTLIHGLPKSVETWIIKA